MDKKTYSDVKIKELPQSEVEITGSISAEEFGACRNDALKHINESVTVPGFRKGHVPENILASKVGEMAILEEMAEIALARNYPRIIVDHKINAIGRPHIQITKIAKDNPLEFKITTAIMPEVKLPDYKIIAAEHNLKKEETVSVNEKEVDDFITNLRKSRVDHSSHDHSLSKEEHDAEIEKSMPELTDEFAQSLGEFKSVADLKKKVEEGLIEEKKQKAKEKRRIAISEAIMNATELSLPNIVVESELDRMAAQFNDDITRMGVKPEDYLSHIKKTMDDMRKEWRVDAEKKAKLQIILNKISVAEKLLPNEVEVQKEIDHILAHYKDADPDRARGYVEQLFTNEEVFKFFESQK